MRCLGTFCLMCCMLVGGAVAVNVDPQLPGQVVAVGASGVGWVTDALSRLGDNATPHPASPAPLSTARPVTVGPEPTSIPAPLPASSPSSTLPAATPSSTTPAWIFSWSSQDRIWAVAILEWDQRLDTAAESTYPQFHAYYAGWVADWVATLADIQSFEAGIAPSAAQRGDPPQWFATAIVAHRADEQSNPGSAGWDNEWIANYERLERLWAAL